MAVNIFDELHSATTEGIVADGKQIRHGSNSTVSAELENKIDFPSGGSDGQVLTLYKHSPAWKDAQGGSSSADKVTFDPSDTSLEGETVQVAVSELANGVALCSEDPSDDGTIDGQLRRHQNDGLHAINPKTKAANVSFEKGSTGMSAETAQEAIEELNEKKVTTAGTGTSESEGDVWSKAVADLALKQYARVTGTPRLATEDDYVEDDYDPIVEGDYLFDIDETTKPTVITWSNQTNTLHVYVESCPNIVRIIRKSAGLVCIENNAYAASGNPTDVADNCIYEIQDGILSIHNLEANV